jgi:hypothetical protein
MVMAVKVMVITHRVFCWWHRLHIVKANVEVKARCCRPLQQTSRWKVHYFCRAALRHAAFVIGLRKYYAGVAMRRQLLQRN